MDSKIQNTINALIDYNDIIEYPEMLVNDIVIENNVIKLMQDGIVIHHSELDSDKLKNTIK